MVFAQINDVRKRRTRVELNANLVLRKDRRKPWTIPLSIPNVATALFAFAIRASTAASLPGSRRPVCFVVPSVPHRFRNRSIAVSG